MPLSPATDRTALHHRRLDLHGWTWTIKRRLAGAASCTHLAEMLIAMGTAAYQTVVPFNRMNGRETEGFALAKKVDSCYAYAAERPLMRRLRAESGGE